MSALIGHSRIAADDVESHDRSVADSVYGVLSPEDAGSTPARYSRHASVGPLGGKPEFPTLYPTLAQKRGIRAPQRRGSKRAQKRAQTGLERPFGGGPKGPFGAKRGPKRAQLSLLGGPWGVPGAQKRALGGPRGPQKALRKRPSTQENDHQHKKTTIKTPRFQSPFLG